MLLEKNESMEQPVIEKNRKKYMNAYRKSGGVIVTAEWPCNYSADQVTALENREAEFNTLLSRYEQKLTAALAGFDNVPCACLDFGGTAWLMSLAYGCDLIKIGGRINAEPLYHSADDALEITKRENISEYGLYPEILSRIQEFQQRWAHIPITISDNQSPIDVLTCILKSEEAMLAMFDQPETIHHIMGIITQSMIEINRHLEKSIKNFGGFHANSYIPFGMHVSDDNAAFLSPSMYKEFALPYVDILSREFGGVEYHCCLGYSQNLDVMASANGFIGFDANPDFNPLEKILALVGQKENMVWNIFNFPWSRNENRDVGDEQMFKNMIDVSEGKCSLILNVYDDNKDTALGMADRIKNYAAKCSRNVW